MKSLVVLFALIGLGLYTQAQKASPYTIYGDTVTLTSCDSSELVIRNHTDTVRGFLYNTGGGLTIFKRALTSGGNGVIIIGIDTLRAWLQGGNSWGTAGFFGTLDSNTINFYTNNRHRAQLSGNGTFSTDSDVVIHGVRVGMGPGNNGFNTVVGSGALLQGPAINGSVAVGYHAAQNATASLTAVGASAGQNASGTSTLIGSGAGEYEKGNGLVAVGVAAGLYIQGGYDIAIGDGAMDNDSSTNWGNVAVGALTVKKLTTGGYNTIIGTYTADSLTTGSYNTFLGQNTGQGLQTGSYNTIIGAQILGVTPGVSNSIMLADGQGNTRLFSDAVGDIGVGTLTPHSLFQVTQPASNGTGTASVLAGSGTITGTGTEFTNTFKIGDSITIYTIGGPNGNTHETQVITAIASDVSMTTTPFTLFQAGKYAVSSRDILAVKGYGYVGIATDTPTSRLDINGKNGFSQLRLRTQYTPTSSSDPNGSTGDTAVDDNYFYYKTTTGWKRVALSTF